MSGFYLRNDYKRYVDEWNAYRQIYAAWQGICQQNSVTNAAAKAQWETEYAAWEENLPDDGYGDPLPLVRPEKPPFMEDPPPPTPPAEPIVYQAQSTITKHSLMTETGVAYTPPQRVIITTPDGAQWSHSQEEFEALYEVAHE